MVAGHIMGGPPGFSMPMWKRPPPAGSATSVDEPYRSSGTAVRTLCGGTLKVSPTVVLIALDCSTGIHVQCMICCPGESQNAYV
jgi:hypothetical protein